MNKKRMLIEIKKNERMIKKEFNKFAEKYDNEDEAIKAWNEQYKEDKIRHFMKGFNNSNDNPYLVNGAVFMSIMTMIENPHIKHITIIPNIKYYESQQSEPAYTNGQLNIECLWSNCIGKHRPYIFWSWIPAKQSIYKNSIDKNERAYIIPLCEVHSMKVRKNFKLLSDYIKTNIIPLTDSFKRKEI